MFGFSRFSVLTLAALIAFSLGCGDLQQAKKDIKNTTSSTKKNLDKLKQRGSVDPLVLRKFEQIRAAYIAFYEKNQRGPASWDELRQAASAGGIGGAAIRDAQVEGYTVVWNLPIGKYLQLEDSRYLLAYDNRAPSGGGWVLLVDNTIERMSKEDFEFFYQLEKPNFD